MKTRISYWIAFILAALHAAGFEAVMRVDPAAIGLNEAATLSIEIRNAANPPPPPLPVVDGLQIVPTGQSQRINWVNGRTDRSISFTYLVYPQHSGEFTIPAFEYAFDGISRTIGPVRLEVATGTADGQAVQSWAERLFATIEIEPESVYVQQPFWLTLSVYSQPGVQLTGNLNLQGLPEAGLASLHWQETTPTREVINETIYDVRRFRAQTRALHSGQMTFAPVLQTRVMLEPASGRQPRNASLFDSLYDQIGRQTRPVELPIQPARIAILPLPAEGRPDGFAGAVGRFRIAARAQPAEVAAGDPATLLLRISGEGNFDQITAPDFPDRENFRVFGDPVRKTEPDGLLFEYIISPRSAEQAEVPPLSFAYFDTAEGAYKTIQTGPIALRVTGDSGRAKIFVRQDNLQPEQDIPLLTESEMQKITTALRTGWSVMKVWWWTLPAVGLTALGTAFLHRFLKQRKRDTARMRRRKAPVFARAGLRAAERARHQADAPAFYEAIWSALTGYFGNRLNLPPGDITTTEVERRLHNEGFPPSQTGPVLRLLEQIEKQRYGSRTFRADPADMKSVREKTTLLLKQWDRIHPKLKKQA